MTSILIIEDEPELVRVLRDYLINAGLEVFTAYRGDTGLSAWQHNHPDLVILDLNLPGMDGLDVAAEIRRHSRTPILMLTARVEETDQVLGLELGADDYITKPFSPRLVVARVRALLRRATAQPPETFSNVRLADLTIDPNTHTVQRNGCDIHLTPTEFKILLALGEQPGRVFTRQQLLEASQGTSFAGYQRAIDAHIKNIRAKLKTEPNSLPLIETVFGVGYRCRKE